MRGPLLPPPPRRVLAGAEVPTVNVAFLLLVFFLLAARLAPPAALDVDPPVGAGEAAGPARVVELDAAGALAFGAARGEAALGALAAGEGPVLLRADADAPGAAVAALLPRLLAAGASRVDLEVRPR